MELLTALSGFCWPGLAMMIIVTQFVTICLLRRKVRRLEEFEFYYYQTQSQQFQPSFRRR